MPASATGYNPSPDPHLSPNPGPKTKPDPNPNPNNPNQAAAATEGAMNAGLALAPLMALLLGTIVGR